MLPKIFYGTDTGFRKIYWVALITNLINTGRMLPAVADDASNHPLHKRPATAKLHRDSPRAIPIRSKTTRRDALRSGEPLSKTMTNEDKAAIVSDYHKDFYGVRPDRNWMASATVDELAGLYDKISKEFAEKKSTPEGREQLRAQGWKID